MFFIPVKPALKKQAVFYWPEAQCLYKFPTGDISVDLNDYLFEGPERGRQFVWTLPRMDLLDLLWAGSWTAPSLLFGNMCFISFHFHKTLGETLIWGWLFGFCSFQRKVLSNLKPSIEYYFFIIFATHGVQYCVYTCATLPFIISLIDKVLGKKYQQLCKHY